MIKIKNKIIILVFLLICNYGLFGQTVPNYNNLSLEEKEKSIQSALEFRKAEDYRAAITMLNQILVAYPDDAPILLLKGDIHLQGREFTEAVNTFKILLPLNYESTITKINLSYALFMNNDVSEALVFAESAWKNDTTSTNAIVNYFNALLWNVKTDDAALFLAKHSNAISEDQALVMKARLFTTSGDYKNGLSHYDTLVQRYPNKHYTQEYAEVLVGKREVNLASTVLQTGKDLYSTNEYNAILQKIENAQMDNAGVELVYFKDKAKNVRTEMSAWWQQKDGPMYRFGARVGNSTSISALDEKTYSKFINLSISEKWSMAFTGQTNIFLQNISFDEKRKFSSITGSQSLYFKPTDRRMYGLFVNTDILNYTSSILRQNIRSYSLGYMTHIMFDGENGVYSQGSISTISDGNRKYDFFGSLYHLFSTKPLFKMGINISALHFTDDKVTTYF